MLLQIIIGALVLVAILLAFAASRPDSFRIQRTAIIQARPEAISAFLADFRKWSSWSPYEKKDPALKRTYTGPVGGPGAVYAWDGNADIGAGRMEILESSPARVVIKLDFFKPFKASNTGVFALEYVDGLTAVTWSMHGPQPFRSKLMGLFLDCDKMVGKDFEAGLANLKALAEKPLARPAFA